MKSSLIVFMLIVFCVGTRAGAELPQSIDFTFSPQIASDIADKEFCRISAGTETYYPILGSATSTESLTITCDGKTIRMGGKVSDSGWDQRVNEILSQAMSQLLKMGYTVVSCERDGNYYLTTCTVAKHVLSSSPQRTGF
ncbi:MAG: hypothetical protein H6625_01975 [Bdellovibrionaceae bacterium]|nr:hypothetical protein [Pseudobdellovibrionaceae bacterium]